MHGKAGCLLRGPFGEGAEERLGYRNGRPSGVCDTLIHRARGENERPFAWSEGIDPKRCCRAERILRQLVFPGSWRDAARTCNGRFRDPRCDRRDRLDMDQTGTSRGSCGEHIRGGAPFRPRNRVRPGEPAPRNLKLSRTGSFNGEPTIAVDPRDPDNLVAAWMHTGTPRTNEIMVTASIDGGASWNTPVPIAHVDPAYHASPDVSVIFDGYGTAHLTFIDMDADPASDPRKGEFAIRSGEVVHMRSQDGGFTWSQPVPVRHSSETPDFAIDRPWIAVDDSGGPRDGWLDVVTISFFDDTNHEPPQHVHLKRSEDHGATWGPDVQMDDLEYGTGPLAGVPFRASSASVGVHAVDRVSTCGLGCLSRHGLPARGCFHQRRPHLHALEGLGCQPGHPPRVHPLPNARSGPRPAGTLLGGLARWQARPEGFGPAVRAEQGRRHNLVGTGADQRQPTGPRRRRGPTLGGGWPGWQPGDRLARPPGGWYGIGTAFRDLRRHLTRWGGNFLPNRKLSDQLSPYDRVPCCNSFLGLALDWHRLHAVWVELRAGLWNIYYARTPVGPGR